MAVAQRPSTGDAAQPCGPSASSSRCWRSPRPPPRRTPRRPYWRPTAARCRRPPTWRSPAARTSAWPALRRRGRRSDPVHQHRPEHRACGGRRNTAPRPAGRQHLRPTRSRRGDERTRPQRRCPAPLRFAIVSSGGGLCCTTKQISPPVQPAPNQVNQFAVNLPAGSGVGSAQGSQFNDILVVVAVGPGSLPVNERGTHGVPLRLGRQPGAGELPAPGARARRVKHGRPGSWTATKCCSSTTGAASREHSRTRRRRPGEPTDRLPRRAGNALIGDARPGGPLYRRPCARWPPSPPCAGTSLPCACAACSRRRARAGSASARAPLGRAHRRQDLRKRALPHQAAPVRDGQDQAHEGRPQGTAPQAQAPRQRRHQLWRDELDPEAHPAARARR